MFEAAKRTLDGERRSGTQYNVDRRRSGNMFLLVGLEQVLESRAAFFPRLLKALSAGTVARSGCRMHRVARLTEQFVVNKLRGEIGAIRPADHAEFVQPYLVE